MTYNIVLAGVGGQGVLSLATIIAAAAKNEQFSVRQSEVHGMAQRGGSVLAHLRISDASIPGDLIPRGKADMILSMEPLEGLRYLDFLKPDGVIVSAAEPFRNIPEYPPEDEIIATLELVPGSRVINTALLAREAGHSKSANVVLVGAASTYLPMKTDSFLEAIRSILGRKGEHFVELNRHAFRLGRSASSETRHTGTKP